MSLAVPDVESSGAIAKLAAARQKPQILAVHESPDDEMKAASRSAGARMCLPTAMVLGSVRELLGV